MDCVTGGEKGGDWLAVAIPTRAPHSLQNCSPSSTVLPHWLQIIIGGWSGHQPTVMSFLDELVDAGEIHACFAYRIKPLKIQPCTDILST